MVNRTGPCLRAITLSSPLETEEPEGGGQASLLIFMFVVDFRSRALDTTTERRPSEQRESRLAPSVASFFFFLLLLLRLRFPACITITFPAASLSPRPIICATSATRSHCCVFEWPELRELPAAAICLFIERASAYIRTYLSGDGEKEVLSSRRARKK